MSFRVAGRLDGIEKSLIRRIFDSAPPGAINLGLGQPDLPTPAPLALAGVSAIAEGRTGYTPTAGDPELRQAVAGRYPTLASGADNVLITVGSQEGIFLVCLSLLDPGSELLYPDPGYPAYPMVARLLGATPVPYPLRAECGFSLRAEDVEQRLTSRTGIVLLSAPSNPTGAGHAAPELEALLPVLRSRAIPWVSDEVYGALTYDDQGALPGEISPDGGLVISGLSKELSMTGWRIGWVVGPQAIVSRAIGVQQYLVTCASSVSQRAALGAFTPEGRACGREYLARLCRRRSLMAHELAKIPDIRFAMPHGGFYFFVDVSAYGSSLELGRRILQRAGVITIPGPAFGAGGEGYLRLSFAAGESDIVRGVRSMGKELSAN